MSATSTHGALDQLRELIAKEGGELADALVSGADPPAFGPLAAHGERTRSRAGEYELVLETVLEGYLVHYARPRLLAPHDVDFRLLAGDYLYALGLARLAQLGDLDAVSELGELITLCAQAHAVGASPAPASAASPASLWALSTLAIVGGRWPAHDEAIRAARTQAADAAHSVAEAASRRAEQLAIANELQRALIAFRAMVSRPSGST